MWYTVSRDVLTPIGRPQLYKAEQLQSTLLGLKCLVDLEAVYHMCYMLVNLHLCHIDWT